jgi:predicted short-subunit dehydrogenase-like oxidoreductase (DUF2520 family)
VDPLSDTIGLAGSGPVAQTIGQLLIRVRAPVVGIASRTPEHAAAAAARFGVSVAPLTYQQLPDVASHIIVAVTDRAIPEVADLLTASARTPRVVVHTCGASGIEPLAQLRRRGASCGVMHPLQTVPDREHGAAALSGATFAIGGDALAVAWADRISALIGGRPMRVSDQGFPLYHAGAALAGNGAFALVEAAVALLAAAGVERSRALDALAPLCRRSLENALTIGAAALTGPVARGDVDTVGAHLAAIRSRVPGVEPLYRTAGLALAELARANGLDERAAHELEEALTS